MPVLEKCGWAPRDEDAHLTRKLRGEVIAALPTFCAADDGVYAEAKRRFDAFRAGDDAALPSNISRRSTSWCSRGAAGRPTTRSCITRGAAPERGEEVVLVAVEINTVSSHRGADG